MIRPILPLIFALALAGCDGGRAADAPIVVSAIGGAATLTDPDAGPLDAPDRLLMAATAQGLVRFDAAGQIEPGLAERWTVAEDGRSYIFRLKDAVWANGQPVTAAEVVRILRRATARNSRNALAPFLVVIDEIVEMTPQVIEVRLSNPRPDLLKLFAQPELAIFRTGPAGGSGPLAAERIGDALLLRPAPDPAHMAIDDDAAPRRVQPILLRGERAAMAVGRFRAGKVDAILGGSFADWPILQVINPPQERVKIDPALGLFGLAVVSREGFLADPANRTALAMSIDRAALTRAFHPDWQTVEALLPLQLDSAAAPAIAPWGPLPLDARRENARQLVQKWRQAHPGKLVVRIALPPGPGSTLVWGAVAQSLLSIGISPQRVAIGDDAELRLIDEVAPYDSGRWFLVTACRLCSPEAMAAIEAAREAPDLSSRAQRIAEADIALTADAAYIPIAVPFRWAIVTARLNGWQGNTRAWHPLNHLRNEGE
ncbi:ABC transporter substrate-binding protein [Sphingomonas sp. G-3-2-10]|uniref:ABC transporter substrate-binding protein n=1 Tax=Sphingomonas sp. G-3-2-10 TaxID=2728838 RepID=UPI001469E827|nr:ABC transporter substrate-binding protein [Sphingomonas sp. G-3-2-10]NML06333.1 ABC transporter substrate-binding protein [Sphingomonas sp. G-3-2-10]